MDLGVGRAVLSDPIGATSGILTTGRVIFPPPQGVHLNIYLITIDPHLCTNLVLALS